jgi:hypothetical protein
VQSPEELISEKFNAYFARFDIRIKPEDVTIGSHRMIGRQGWRIAYRVDPDDAGRPTLEFYATHRMTSDSRVRIWSDGHTEDLETIHEAYVYDAKLPGAEQAAEAAYLAHNRSVAEKLRDRGLYPDGDINAFLRTGGAADEGSGEGLDHGTHPPGP